MEEYQKFLEETVRAIVNHPDDVTSERSVDELGVLLTLSVHPDDMSQVIGKMGRTATAIRTLLRIVGMKHGAKVSIKINDPRSEEE